MDNINDINDINDIDDIDMKELRPKMFPEYKELIDDTVQVFEAAGSDWMLNNALAVHYDDNAYLRITKEEAIQKLLEVDDLGAIAALMLDALENINEYIELHTRTTVMLMMQGLDPKECIGQIKRTDIEADRK